MISHFLHKKRKKITLRIQKPMKDPEQKCSEVRTRMSVFQNFCLWRLENEGSIWGAKYKWNVTDVKLILVLPILVGVIRRCPKEKMNTKSLPVWPEWPVNCFLKALGENLYLGQLDTWWPVRNNLKLKKWYAIMIRHNLMVIWACWNASSTASWRC